MPNRLAKETSPYLLQHRENPVEWFPWGEEAFAKAKAENKPVFLSIGYSSCHWCHVMAHESFEDEQVARVLNEEFVSVKVDREERPDVDEAYMTAVQLSSGHGGWPMSVFLTAERLPFFAGTYFPKADRGNVPGFLSVCRQIANAWKTRKPELLDAARQFETALRQTFASQAPGTFDKFDENFLAQAVKAIGSDFDRTNGGFGTAPKFPPHAVLRFLLSYVTEPSAPEELREVALGISFHTLDQMALGGIHDHVGGGFHRYSTDAEWHLPHFEKMLYDNALMLGNYVHASALAAVVSPEAAEIYQNVARGIVAWIAREMTSPEGLFYSALDADSEGEEGKYYVWSLEEIQQVLGDRAERFAKAYNCSLKGNFHDESTGLLTDANVLHLIEPTEESFAEDLEKLRTARRERPRPGLDDKAIVSWNGLMIASLAKAGALRMARAAADAILAHEKNHGELPHHIAQGRPSGKGFLDDYAEFAAALLTVSDLCSYDEYVVEAAAYHAEAERLIEEMISLFFDEERGGFFMTSDHHEELFGRTKPVFDQPTPSPNSSALACLIAAGDEDRAIRTLNALLGWMQRAPQASAGLYAAAIQLAEVEEVEETVAEPSPASRSTEVVVKLAGKELRAEPDGSGVGHVLISIPDGYHLNGPNPPARWLVPTKLEVRPLKAIIDYPPAPQDRYEGDITIPFTVSLPAGQKDAEFELVVSYQACTETECLLPAEKAFGCAIVK